MFDSILYLDSGSLSNIGVLVCFGVAIVLGLIISLVYIYTTPSYTKNFSITIALLPAIIHSVLIIVNGNLGTSVAVLGIFSLVRFRSVPGSSKEIMSVFLTTAIGLALGMGFPIYAVLITIIIGIALIIYAKVPFGEAKSREKMLRVTLPENLDYTDVFEDIFEKYLKKVNEDRVKTVNMGTMYELSYIITMKDIKQEKAMIDEIRCRNGNLSVSCGRVPVNNVEL